jgi:hypothetical protein
MNHGAGIDVSPAVRDYLGLGPLGLVDWRFVEQAQVPAGPWSVSEGFGGGSEPLPRWVNVLLCSPLEKLPANLFLERLNLEAQSRLAEVDDFCRATEVQRLRERKKRRNMSKLHAA